VDTLLTGNPGVVLEAPQCSGCSLLYAVVRVWQYPDLWVEGSIPSRFKAPLAQLVRATVVYVGSNPTPF